MSRKTERNANHKPDEQRKKQTAKNHADRMERGYNNRHEEAVERRKEKHEKALAHVKA